MANPHKFYLDHMHKKTGYRATYDPGKNLQIGYIGQVDENGIFSVYSSLEKEGIPMEVNKDAIGIEEDYTSNESVDITIKLGGKAPVAGSVLTEAEAGFQLQFKKANSVVFKTSGHKTHHLVNLKEITSAILEKYRNGNWDKHWLVITELVEADSATIIIANSSNASLELKAKAGVGTDNLKITDASLGLNTVSEKGSTLKYIAQQGLTPLYRVMGIRDPWIGRTRVVTRGDEKPELIAETDFKERPLNQRELEDEDDDR